MDSFLSELIAKIDAEYQGNYDGVCIILPGKRAGLFFHKFLIEYYQKAVIPPEVITFDSLVNNLTELQTAGAVQQLIELYNSYAKVMKGGKVKPETFYEFLGWGQNLLSDFAEIDNYLVDPKQIFEYLRDVRAIEMWSPAGGEMTEKQEEYLRFWSLIGDLYKEYKSRLKASGFGYSGMIFREVAESKDDLQEKIPYKHIYFAGFNAWSKVEEKLIRRIREFCKITVEWDYDPYYVLNKDQEAGNFLRRYLVPRSMRKESFFSQEKNIRLIETASQVGQAREVGKVLMNLDRESELKTALVLADEGALLPVLNSLPENVREVNVTMGLPIKFLPVHSFWNNLFESYISSQARGKKRVYYFKSLDKLFASTYAQFLFDHYRVSGFYYRYSNYVKKFNRIYVDLQELNDLFPDQDTRFLELLLPDWQDKTDVALRQILQLCAKIGEIVRSDEMTSSQLELEYLFIYTKVFKRILTLYKDYGQPEDIYTLKNLFYRLSSVEKLSFFGEPLKGVQLMGMLETRAIDFDNIILCGANEGVLPAGRKQQSFIPFEVKRHFGLPSYRDKDSVFAYYFYRLIQRAKNVWIIYESSAADAAKDKSRFVRQLEFELPSFSSTINIIHQKSGVLTGKEMTDEIVIEKNDFVYNRLKEWGESGISPSALNTYLECPLDFYYKYVLGYREEEIVEEQLGAASQGTVLHNALEEIYQIWEGKVLESIQLEKADKKVKEVLLRHMNILYKDKFEATGKNLILLELFEKYLRNFLKWERTEITRFRDEGKVITLLKLEEEFSRQLSLDVNGEKLDLLLKGKIDRVDRCGNLIRIWDYKSGNVQQADVTFNPEDGIEKLKPKALQLLLYSSIFDSEKYGGGEMEAALITLKKNKELHQPLRGKDRKPYEIDAMMVNEFQGVIRELLHELFDRNVPFRHREKAKYCLYCG